MTHSWTTLEKHKTERARKMATTRLALIFASAVLSQSLAFMAQEQSAKCPPKRRESAFVYRQGDYYSSTASSFTVFTVSGTKLKSSASTDSQVAYDSDNSEFKDLLHDAICKFNSTAADEIIQELAAMRQAASSSDQLLDDLLSHGPDRKLPFWTKIRPLAKFSNRARMASLSRVLDLTTPPAAEGDSSAEQDDETSQQRRRRRALVSLLRTLSRPDDNSEPVPRFPAIVSLERRARKSQQGLDMLSRRPADLETPNYIVIESKNNFEIRQYEPFTVCSVSMNKPRPVDGYKTDATLSDSTTSGAKAFGALAGYLFGKNKQEQSMAMTTPVFNTGVESDRTMSFVLPSSYWKPDGVETAPQPMEQSGVTLERKELGERAVVMYGGYASKTETDKRKTQLLDQIKRSSTWSLVATDEPPALAQYNDPFTPPWKRLNEVSVEIQRAK